MRVGPYERHRGLLQQAVRAMAAGECCALFTRAGRGGTDAGMRSARTAEKVFGSLLGRPFDLGQPGELGRVRTETDLAPWRAARGAAGRMPPIGFPRSNHFG